jgi:hypothetical protein
MYSLEVVAGSFCVRSFCYAEHDWVQIINAVADNANQSQVSSMHESAPTSRSRVGTNTLPRLRGLHYWCRQRRRAVRMVEHRLYTWRGLSTRAPRHPVKG